MLLHHALPQGGPDSITGTVGSTGWLGVSLFFVLSGFLLTVRYAPDGALTATRRDFWLERIARLAPTYLLALAFALPLFARDVRVGGLGAGAVAAISAAVLTVQQAWRPELACQWDCPAWSLSVEAWFYLAFPFLIAILGGWVMRARGRGALLLVGSLAMSAVIFPWLEQIGSDWPLPVYSLSPLARWPEFTAGIGLAALMGGWRPASRTPGIVLIGLGAILITGQVLSRGYIESIGSHLLPASLPGFALLIAGCWALRGHAALGLGAPWLVLLGEASYALYLLHAPLHSYVLALTNRVVGRGYDASWGVFGVYLVVAIGLSLAVHRAFELPWRQRLRVRFGLTRPS